MREDRWSGLTPAIGGIPGSGKSTVAYPLVDRINALAGHEVAMGLGTDGWHYSQAQLRVMPVSRRVTPLTKGLGDVVPAARRALYVRR